MPTRDHYEPGAPCWVDLATGDEDAAVSFYTGLFDWSTRRVPSRQDTDYVLFLRDGREVAACMVSDRTASGEQRSAWTTYLAGEAKSAAERAYDVGGTILAGPVDVLEDSRLAFLADPAGAMFGIWETGEHGGARLADEPGTPVWYEVYVPDIEAATDFYVALFGYRAEDNPSAPAPYRTLHLDDGDAELGIMEMTAEWEGVPPHWMVYFAVDSAEDGAERVTALGGTVQVEPFDAFFGRLVVATDPEGAVFTLIESTSEA